ncbi:Copia protein [Cucumis melo var. makuwa]|uniref:Copia protein n=1 Tax=Cucumis melo var. makuwa TaxID=1194695 RepID=A0A5A7SU75_CUCMM|nr:Copia protein [Cucumis melo var. makuwa]TYK30363.1 Copia protein [Cucumis melo var. makuwa]
MSESDRYEIVIPENIGEQGNVDIEVILDGNGSNDENEVSARVTENEIREDRSENISKYDSSLGMPIALPKGLQGWEGCSIEIIQLKKRMSDGFEIKDLGNLKYFPEMEIGMLGCHLADIPIEFNCRLGNSNDKVPVHKEQYQRLVGSIVDRKSTSGYCTFVWGNLVIWRSKKQEVMARSNAEAEYAMSLGICEEIWLQKVLSDLHENFEIPMKLFCDNKATISIVNHSIQHDRTKHVVID